jgi:hypothetical protein
MGVQSMSQTDGDIVAAFENLREFCRQVALMLRTADGMMAKSGWGSASKGTVFDGASASIEWPTYWLPTYFSRFYINPRVPTCLSFVSVIVGYPKEAHLVQDALVSGGWFDYGTAAPGNNWQYAYAKAHLWAKSRTDDGQLCWGDVGTDWKGDVPPTVTQIASFAYPLSELTNGADLQTRVIDRLVGELRERQSDRSAR